MIISELFKNFFIILFVVALIMTVVKVVRARRAGYSSPIAYTLWGEVLFYSVGVGFVLLGLLHAYAQEVSAPSIGWQPSPFEYELGWMEIPLGIVAIASLWQGFEFRLAATIIFCTFSFAAAAQHIAQIVCCQNYAPGNAGPTLWIGDIFIPLVILACAVLSRRGAPA